MLSFLLYDVKAAVALAVFFMFYRLMLRKETFHRLNRIVLVGSVVIAFLLPLCIITIHKPMEMKALEQAVPMEGMASVVEKPAPWWSLALIILFWAGAALVLARVIMSILSIARIIRRGERVQEEDGCKIIVTIPYLRANAMPSSSGLRPASSITSLFSDLRSFTQQR